MENPILLTSNIWKIRHGPDMYHYLRRQNTGRGWKFRCYQYRYARLLEGPCNSNLYGSIKPGYGHTLIYTPEFGYYSFNFVVQFGMGILFCLRVALYFFKWCNLCLYSRSNPENQYLDMKKFFYLLLISFIFLSCKKEDPPAPTTLIGSSWTYRPDGNHYETIDFLNTNEVQVTGNLSGSDYSKNGIYTYDESNVTIELKNELKAGYASGNSLWLNDPIWAVSFPEYSVTYQYIKN